MNFDHKPNRRSTDEREEILAEKVPATFAEVDLNKVLPDKKLARSSSHPRNDVALTTSTHYGYILYGYWSGLRARNGYPVRCIARQNGAAVWLYNRWPDEQEDTAARLYFGSGAIVQFRGAPDPVDAVEVVYRQDRQINNPLMSVVASARIPVPAH